MIEPVEMKTPLPVSLHDGATSTTTDVWKTLVAARDGDLAAVAALARGCPALVTCQYNYTPPLHFAVREGHEALVRYLVDAGGLDPTYVTYPFKDSLVTMATDRGFVSMAAFLESSLRNPRLARERGESGEIHYAKDDVERQFQRAVNDNELAEAERLLEQRPGLALDETASWGEGILMMPANRKNRRMLELLLRHGAHVPDVSKWGRAYYFKHYDIAAFLMDHGMSPNHQTWHHVTLLHDMAQEGDVRKAELLLDHGAAIDPIDEEYSSTPLGLAARWDQRKMVRVLLERGADPNKAGAPWATPLAWAERKGHRRIADELKTAGATHSA